MPPPLRSSKATRPLRTLNAVSDLLLASPHEVPWQQVVTMLGEVSRVSRCYVFLVKDPTVPKRVVEMVAEWCAPGVSPQIGAAGMDDFVLADHGFRRIETVLASGGWINDRVADCPQSERAVFEAQDIQSILLLPITVRSEWVGLLGCDEVQTSHRWPDTEVEFVRGGARLLAAALDRQREEQAARRREMKLEALRDAAHLLLRASDEVPFQDFVETIGRAAESDRIDIFRHDTLANGAPAMRRVAAWCAPGSDHSTFHEVPFFPTLQRWYAELSVGHSIHGPAAGFPDAERALLEVHGMQALLVIPLLVGEQFHGFIIFDGGHRAEGFDFEDQLLLRGATDNLAQAVERVSTSAQVRKREEQIRQLLEFNPVPTLVTDRDKRILKVNRAFVEAFGYTALDLTDLPAWWHLCAPDAQAGQQTAAQCHAAMEQARAANRRVTPLNELTLRTRDGSLRTMACRLALTDDRHIVVFHDLSDRMRAEEAMRARAVAEQANQAKTEFLAMMNHELRTPLNSIIGPSEILATEVHEPGLRALVEVVHTSGQHLLELINDILDLTRIESGHVRLRYEAVSPATYFERALVPLAERTRAKGLEWALVLHPDLPPQLILEPRLVHRLLFNLVGNATKFTEKGAVTVRVSPDVAPGSWTLAVQDTGPGIPPRVKMLSLTLTLRPAPMPASATNVMGTNRGGEMRGPSIMLVALQGRGKASLVAAITCLLPWTQDPRGTTSERPLQAMMLTLTDYPRSLRALVPTGLSINPSGLCGFQLAVRRQCLYIAARACSRECSRACSRECVR